MFKYAMIALIVCQMFQSKAQASNSAPRFLSVSIPGLINTDSSGYYLQLIYHSLGVPKEDVVILPTKRALRVFSNASQATCMFPLSRMTAINLGIDIRGMIFSQPFNTSFATLISQRSTMPVQALQDLNNGTVGAVLGFPIADEVVNAAKHVVKPNSVESLLRMLELGRIDYAYIHYPDLSMQYIRTKITAFPESKLKFNVVPDALACTIDKSEIVREFNKVVNLMYEDGSIKRILGAAYTGRD